MASALKRRIFTLIDESFPLRSLYLILGFALKLFKPFFLFTYVKENSSLAKILAMAQHKLIFAICHESYYSHDIRTTLLSIAHIVGSDKQKNHFKARVNNILEKQKTTLYL